MIDRIRRIKDRLKGFFLDNAILFKRGVAVSLGAVIVAAVLSVMLFSLWPHVATWWGGGSPTYVQFVPCDSSHSMAPDVAGDKDCYPVETLRSLDKALRISDAIALLAVLVTIVTLMLPVFGFLSIRLERRSIEKDMDRRFGELTQKQHERMSSELSRLNAYPTLLSLANLTADKYATDPIGKNDSDNSETTVEAEERISRIEKTIGRIREHSANADRVRSALTNLLEESDKNFVAGLNILSGFIENTDNLSPSEFIIAVKTYLYEIYKANYVDTDTKTKEFREFVEKKFKRRIDVFLSEQDP
uniref:Uncharacterized protein n=1 Tax=Candidatus Kentrum eta TaxID=2126337 RepID=A0A450UXW3_9GAMM|nr:MAG: hypothetical protein BECKH772A_GA0070896_1001522 [Candidatus Kentron sp. H]VFJ91037.1 MAG: hypothetical protein BECKH772B_GA0070898_1001322 [Candidatus Kentron sp. H]VFJ97343.1 MAG: hypothetical protein BECKH772C_GA0070978_1001222 [Candidatus Kentron sp. H]